MRIRGSAAILALALGALGFMPGSTASASSLRTLFDFCNGTGCTDGSQPSPLLMDQSGNLYGTTQHGGANQGGTVFELMPSGGSRWKYRVLYTFCTQTNCADGLASQGKLIADTQGDLYGTTSGGGGASSAGTAFELIPNLNRTKWTYRLLHAFCSSGGTSCTDGSIPVSGLTYAGAASGTPYDGTSPLYGTTVDGGRANPGSGVVYQLVPSGGSANETVLYRFCPKSGCADGASPEASVTADGTGNLYGTTAVGGKSGLGTVFELSPMAGNWTETVLHSFCAKTNCPDGDVPQSELVMDAPGTLYGVLSGGKTGFGVAFKLVPSGKTSQETVLHNFCVKTNCTDGESPVTGLVMDGFGNLFGTTEAGGRNNGGTAFELNASFHILYNFCARPSCGDGSEPNSTMLVDGTGHLFGTTLGGGAGNGGTVFEISP
ncbi:MAG TPA: choice-of-anchor tandem repeat GloVer-containing protein [Rhizomicrobium sp.]|nr:choice-of-anchor tandem repeat GloVer-containing protein [Rhizomicrobium sp.]